MRVLLPCVALLLPLLASAAATTEQAATYTAFNPWLPSYPDCVPGAAVTNAGLGGACFGVPAGAGRYRVTIQDDATGAGFGTLHFEKPGGCCQSMSICEGVAEGEVPAGATAVYVTVSSPEHAPPECGLAALAWAPTHGRITLTLAPAGE